MDKAGRADIPGPQAPEAAPDVSAIAAQARDWLLNAVFPLWSGAGFDASSGQFVERLTLQGEPVPLPRRTMVQTRQMFVFSAALRLGWQGPAREVIGRAADVLLRNGRTDDGDWVFSFGTDGQVHDPRRDLYTQAFAIFGLSHAARALERPDLAAAAEETAQRLDQAWRHPKGGFVEGDFDHPHRRQNPHMHLFEAMMALHEATGRVEHLEAADEILGLALNRFIEPKSGWLLEYFDEDLAPASGDAGRIVEPGHQFEWSWLMGERERLGGGDLSGHAERLFTQAERHGISEAGLAWDEIWTDGEVKSRLSRLWPQTERLKATVVRLGSPRGRSERAPANAGRSISRYLDVAVPGIWRDQHSGKADPANEQVLASTGYHIVCAYEVMLGVHGNLDFGPP